MITAYFCTPAIHPVLAGDLRGRAVHFPDCCGSLSFLWSSISSQPSLTYLEGEGSKDSQGFVFRGLGRQMGLEQRLFIKFAWKILKQFCNTHPQTHRIWSVFRGENVSGANHSRFKSFFFFFWSFENFYFIYKEPKVDVLDEPSKEVQLVQLNEADVLRILAETLAAHI